MRSVLSSRVVSKKSVAVVCACAIATLISIGSRRPPAFAADRADQAAPGDVNRDVLAIYDSREEPGPDPSRIQSYLEMPLNHLGYRVTYWDLKRGLPAATAGTGYKAVVTWFGGRIAASRAYLAWATRTARTGTRFIVIGATGASTDASERPLVDGFLQTLGLAVVGTHVADTSRSRILVKDAGMLEFESQLDKGLPGYPVIVARAADVRAHLSVGDPAPGKQQALREALLVATGAGGGYVADGYAMRPRQGGKQVHWLIDPFVFLKAALGDGIVPVPDTTTVSGRRIYFSHIDGDGWINPTEIAADGGQATLASEVVARHLIEPFPDLPVSIGLISCDVDLALGGSRRAADIARQLYALPQVEVASHTHTHPYDWDFYRAYSRAKEMARINPPPPPIRRAPAPTQFGGLFGLSESAPVKSAPPRPAPRPGALPRYKTQQPFDLSKEVAGALATSQSLAPAGKPVALYLWSGDTRPFEAAVRATRQAGVRNLNGGDSRLDAKYPSIAYVPPISRMAGGERQIYSVNSNEFTYTNDWKGPFDTFSQLTQTLERTERPRRLKGFNVYYHMYSGEKAQSLAAVKGHLELARASPVTPITAAAYAAIADAFFGVEFVALATNRWLIRNRADLATIRFDDADALTVDYAASRGVLGHNRHGTSLYVALDPAASEPVLALGPAVPGPAAAAPERAHLVESRWQHSGLTVAPCAVHTEARGFGPGEMTWAGLKPGRYRLTATGANSSRTYDGLVVGADGVLQTVVDADARSGLTLDFACSPQ